MENTKKQSFEAAMAELEDIVAKLEEGNIPLEEMMTLYEKGMKLGAACTAQLDGYEKRIELAKGTADE